MTRLSGPAGVPLVKVRGAATTRLQGDCGRRSVAMRRPGSPTLRQLPSLNRLDKRVSYTSIHRNAGRSGSCRG
jgi:hypothetical protein